MKARSPNFVFSGMAFLWISFFCFYDSNDVRCVFGFWYGEFDIDLKTGMGRANRIVLEIVHHLMRWLLCR